MNRYATLPVSWEKVTLQIPQNPVSARKATLTVSVAEKKTTNATEIFQKKKSATLTVSVAE